MMSDLLSLPEQIVLLHLDDQSGKFMGSYFNACLVASAIAELSLRERIRIEGDIVSVTSRGRTDNDTLDTVLDHIDAGTRPPKLAHLARASGLAQTLRETILDRLVNRGLLRPVQEQVLWLWHRTVYPTVDANPEIALRRQIRDVALGDEDPTPRMILLFALLNGSGALHLALSKPDLKANGKTIDNLARSLPLGEKLGKTLAAIIEEDQVVATIAATTAATS